jgi:transposase
MLDNISSRFKVWSMPRIAPSITVTSAQTEELQRTCRASSSSATEVLRARIILLAAKGWPNDEIVHELGTNKMTVSKWRRRFAKLGMAGLQDAARSGRPVSLSPEQLNRVLTEVTRPPKSRSRWSCRSMSKHAGVSKSRVQQLWEQNDLRPHQTRTFKLSNDPQFEAKFWDVIGLYLNPPTKAVVLCCDEKSQCQALERTQPGLPLGQGQICTRTHDYYRHGTLTLFAALDYLEGKIIAQSAPRHRHQEWLAFLKQIEQEVPVGQDIHLIVDNYATHKHPSVKRWLKKHPRVHLHFTPTSSSWLNLVERFFRDLSQDVISPGSFRSVPELKRAIFNYLAERNDSPKRYVWRAEGEKILAKIQRAREALARQTG